MIVKAQVDLNSLRPDGTTRVRLVRFSPAAVIPTLHHGQSVLVYEPEDNIVGDAVIERVNHDAGYAFLVIDRDSLREQDENK